RSGDDLIIAIAGTTDQLTVKTQFRSVMRNGWALGRIESFVFADGTTWTAAEVDLRVLQAQSTSANDTITAHNSNETSDGGAGNAVLIGCRGDYSYVLARGYGQDVVNEDGQASIFSGGTDRLAFKPLFPYTTLFRSRSGDDLIIAIAGTTDQLTVKTQFRSVI